MNIINKRGPRPGSGAPQQALANATAAWGEAIPEWVVTLAEACDRTSQNAIARKLNYSGSVVSAVINRTYKGGYDTVEQAVRGSLLAETHDCPVLGELPKNDCLGHQKKAGKFQPTSAMRVQLYRACRGDCPHSRMAMRKTEEAAS